MVAALSPRHAHGTNHTPSASRALVAQCADQLVEEPAADSTELADRYVL